MLILSRKLGERFQIGPDVTITVVKVDRNTVRIGIDAPRGTPIQREELTLTLPLDENTIANPAVPMPIPA
jgi:carbon storage regulator